MLQCLDNKKMAFLACPAIFLHLRPAYFTFQKAVRLIRGFLGCQLFKEAQSFKIRITWSFLATTANQQ